MEDSTNSLTANFPTCTKDPTGNIWKLTQHCLNTDLFIFTAENAQEKTTDGVEWTNLSGKTNYGAGGDRAVLIIVSEDVSGPDVVQRRAAIELTEEWRGKLESQGIAREHQSDDLTMVKARYHLNKRHTITGVEMSSPGGERLTREKVLRQITTVMENCNKTGGEYLMQHIQ